MSSKYRDKYGLYRHTGDAVNRISSGRLGIDRKEEWERKKKKKAEDTHD